MKRIAAVIAGLLLLAVAGFVWYAGRRGSTSVEQWVGRQLLAIANDALRPELSYQTLDYAYPATVTLHDVRLTDDDQAFVTATSLRIVFTERPRVGQPVVIETVQLVEPVIELREQEDGTFLGFSNFIESTEGRAREDGGSTRPSDVFAIRKLGIVDGTFVYATPGQDPMRWDNITFDLTSNPDVERGWYLLDALLEHPPVSRVVLDGRINIDEALLELAETALEVDLQPEHYEVLPPQLQQILRDHEVRGALAISVGGLLPLTEAAASDLDVHLLLTDAHIAFGDYVLPIQSLETSTRLTDRQIHIQQFDVAGLGGTLRLNGRLEPAREWTMELKVDAQGLRIEESLRPVAGRPPKYAGRVDVAGRVGASLASLPETVDGTGQLEITEGRLINDPLFGGLVRAVSAGTVGAGGNDQVRADVQLVPGEARFGAINLRSATVAARGEGEIFFNGQIDFRFNAGPLERAQELLGPLGDLVGMVTDKLVKYHVTGRIGEPKLDVKPLGIGTE